MNEFRICDRCKGTNIQSLKKKLQELDSKVTILVGCQNMCGIGRTKPFVIVNHIPVVADTEEELILKIKDKLK